LRIWFEDGCVLMPSPTAARADKPAKENASRAAARKSVAPPQDAEPAEANRRGDLIRAAAKLFREKGFEGTTVRDIAHAVQMRSGSPFYHFANKQELLMAVMEEGLRQGLARTEAAVNASLPARERFVQLVHAHYGILHDVGSDFIPVMLYDWRSLPAQYRRKLIALKDRYDAIWQDTLDELHQQGLLRADPKLARLLILGSMNFSATWFKSSPRKPGTLSLAALADQTAALFVDAQ
jgi:AcrR family transcriptional regulator